MLPLKFERRFERIHPVLDKIGVRSGGSDGDLRAPIPAALLRAGGRAACFDPRVRKGAKNIGQPFEQERAIVAPAILIISADKFADHLPIPFFDLGQEMDAVELDLALRLPKPRQVNTPDGGNDKTGIKSVPKMHIPTFSRSVQLASDSG